MSFVLDVLAAMLSGGLATHELPADPAKEVGISQVFLAVAPSALSTAEEMRRVVDGAIGALHAATPLVAGAAPRYPGESVMRVREESLLLGVAVEDAAWEAFLELESCADWGSWSAPVR